MCFKTDLEDLQPTLKKYVSKRIFNKADAKDIVQNTNIIALKKESEFDSNKNFNGWIITIAKFQIKAYLKSLQRNKIDPVEDGLLERMKSSGFLSDVPFASLIQKERDEMIEEISKHLTISQKIIFCHLSNGLSVKEIKKETGFQLQNIYALRKRLIKKIKKIIKEKKEINQFNIY